MMDWDGTQMVPSRRGVKWRSRTSNRSALVIAQRRALRQAARAVASRHYAPPGPYPKGELKGVDTIIDNSAPAFGPVIDTTNTNGSAVVLNLIQTGTGSWNRIGRKTSLKSLRLKGYTECFIYQGPGNDFNGNMLRISVVWDKQPSGGTIPTFDDIYSETNQSGAETTTVWSQPAFDTLGRFRVIKDMTIPFEAENTPAVGQLTRVVVPIDEYIRLPDLESNYSGQSTPMTIADINSGALYLYGRALQNTTDVTQVNLFLRCRIRYTD